MALKIRLRQQGRRNSREYRIVLADTLSPRDGKCVETLGWYHPRKENEANAEVKEDRVAYWLERGAEPTEKVVHLIGRLAPEAAKAWRERQAAARAKKAASRRKKK
ncbi:MAG: 30S ribosomal protein S16 [Candidatus Algichlamydia australiensis]|nr:30S ribosomal protein S16 [Chlamydiales bacterium]